MFITDNMYTTVRVINLPRVLNTNTRRIVFNETGEWLLNHDIGNCIPVMLSDPHRLMDDLISFIFSIWFKQTYKTDMSIEVVYPAWVYLSNYDVLLNYVINELNKQMKWDYNIDIGSQVGATIYSVNEVSYIVIRNCPTI